MLKPGNAPGYPPGAFFRTLSKTAIPMYEQFIELTNQIFWEGYAETLAQENPERFSTELYDFFNTYQS
ncbi:hypothetical protein [Mucilaginibacter sp.]|uniref:hypothetical protein n=1 Tax=Mucilaginibacter sp. TaxID=1882438 RepID=UPI003D098193